MIIEKCIEYFRNFSDFKDLKISRVVIGLRFSFVEISDGSFGVAGTIDLKTPESSNQKYFGKFSPGNICGQNVYDLLTSKDNFSVLNSLKFACINALNYRYTDFSKYKIHYDKDPIELISFQNKRVALIGAFKSYIEFFDINSVNFKIIELDFEAIPEKFKSYFVDVSKTAEMIENSDIVIITGLSLVNDTFQLMQKHLNDSKISVLTGPSANIPPEILFQNGINIIGATEFTNKEQALKLVCEAASGYHFFKSCARKITIEK
ncbi:MAG: DUF364 domain-containing protein [Bacteroidales bacterium]